MKAKSLERKLIHEQKIINVQILLNGDKLTDKDRKYNESRLATFKKQRDSMV